MTHFEYIIHFCLFKRPGVQGKTEKKDSPKSMTEIFKFKLEQSLNDIE